MKKEILSSLYDLMVYLTVNYSKMPTDFQNLFSETRLFLLRQDLFNYLYDNENDKS